MNATAILAMGRALWSMTACQGNPSQSMRDAAKWMETLVPGCTCVEMTASSSPDAKRVGKFLRETVERVPHCSDCRNAGTTLCPACDVEYYGEDPFYEERYFYVDTGTTEHGVVRWYNSRHVRVPVTNAEYLEFSGLAEMFRNMAASERARVAHAKRCGRCGSIDRSVCGHPVTP